MCSSGWNSCPTHYLPTPDVTVTFRGVATSDRTELFFAGGSFTAFTVTDVVVTPVPEPETYAMWLGGMLILGIVLGRYPRASGNELRVAA